MRRDRQGGSMGGGRGDKAFRVEACLWGGLKVDWHHNNVKWGWSG